MPPWQPLLSESWTYPVVKQPGILNTNWSVATQSQGFYWSTDNAPSQALRERECLTITEQACRVAREHAMNLGGDTKGVDLYLVLMMGGNWYSTPACSWHSWGFINSWIWGMDMQSFQYHWSNSFLGPLRFWLVSSATQEQQNWGQWGQWRRIQMDPREKDLPGSVWQQKHWNQDHEASCWWRSCPHHMPQMD